MNPAPSRTGLILAFAAIYLIWGSTYLGIRIAVETMPPFIMSGVRFTFAGAVLLAFLKARGSAWPTAEQWRDQAIIGACLLAGGNAVVAWSEQSVPSGLTTLILGASPLVMVMMDWLRPGGTRPAPMLWAGFATGLLGLLVLLGPGALPENVRPPVASLGALFFASISWWGGSLFAKYTKSGATPMMAATLQMMCGGALMLLIGLAIGEGPRVNLTAITARSWLAWAYLVVAGSLIAFPVYAWLLKNSTPAKVSTYSYVNPIVAVILGWAVLDEPLTPHIALSAVIIIGAVAIITTVRTRAPKAA